MVNYEDTLCRRACIRLLFLLLSSCTLDCSTPEGCICDAAAELATIAEQFPVEPLQYLSKTLRIPFEEGIKMLQEAGFEVSDD